VNQSLHVLYRCIAHTHTNLFFPNLFTTNKVTRQPPPVSAALPFAAAAAFLFAAAAAFPFKAAADFPAAAIAAMSQFPTALTRLAPVSLAPGALPLIDLASLAMAAMNATILGSNEAE